MVTTGDRVVVLYSNPVVGEGLVRLLGEDPRLDVEGVAQGNDSELELALSLGPAVVVLEEGGSVALADLIHRPSCRRVIDVSAITSECCVLDIERVRAGDDMGRALVDACVGPSRPGAVAAVVIEVAVENA